MLFHPKNQSRLAAALQFGRIEVIGDIDGVPYTPALAVIRLDNDPVLASAFG